MCVAAAIAGSAVLGAVVSSDAASSAADAQRSAADQANATQRNQFNQTRADQAPWRQAGGAAVDQLSRYYGLPGADGKPQTPVDYNQLIQSMPGYQFNVDQGNQAVQRNLAARGMLQSGAAGKALTQYGQNAATSASQQYLNGLQSLAGIGQTSVQATGYAGANAANQIGSNQIYAGNAQAAGYANQANAINSGLSGLAGSYGLYKGYQGYQGGFDPNYGGDFYGRMADSQVTGSNLGFGQLQYDTGLGG